MTDLDRLLELQKYTSILEGDENYEEYQSLKSQLESDLQELVALRELNQGLEFQYENLESEYINLVKAIQKTQSEILPTTAFSGRELIEIFQNILESKEKQD